MEGAPSDNIYATGLPDEFNTEAVNQFFSACGTVMEAKSLGHGCALVRFSTIEEAQLVKDNMNGQQPTGCPKPLELKFAATKHEDWTCPQCFDVQFAKNNECRLCWAPRPTGDEVADAATLAALGAGESKGKGKWNGKGAGKVVAPPAAGTFSAAGAMSAMGGDWTCPMCGDLQFARNSECRMCGSTPDGEWGSGYGKAGGKGGSWGGPFEKGWGKGKKGAGKGPATGIKGLIDGLIEEGLPGGHFDHNKHALYVSNLPHDTTDYELYIMFACFGAIPPRGVRLMATNPGSRVYGFVNFMDAPTAEFAMMAMNGVTQPDGCKLVVKVKTAKGERAPPVEGGDFKGKGKAISPPGIDPSMIQRLKMKMQEGMKTSYELSQWYIITFLGHVQDEGEMKAICDQLLAACAFLGVL